MHEHDHETELTESHPNEGASEPSVSNEVEASVGDDVMNILADVEQQVARLRSVQHRNETELTSLADRAQALDEAERTLETQREQFKSDQNHLESQRQTLEEQSAALKQANQEIEQRQEQLTAQQDELIQQRQEIDERLQTLLELEPTLQARAEQVESDEEQIRSQFAAIEQQQAELNRLSEENTQQHVELEQRETELSQQRQQFEEERQRVENLERQLQEQDEQLHAQRQALADELQVWETRIKETDAAREEAEAHRKLAEELAKDAHKKLEDGTEKVQEYERKLELTGQKLRELSQAFAEQAPQLERGAAAMAMVEQQEAQITQLTNELAQVQHGADPELLRKKEQRITELTEALRQARGQNPDTTDIAALEDHNAALSEEVDQLRTERDAAVIAARQAHEQLESEVTKGALENHGDDEQTAQLNEQIQQLQQKIQERDQQLEQAEEALAASGNSDGQQDAIKQLRRKAKRIREVANHLSRRKQRLKYVRATLRQKGDGAVSSGTGEFQHDHVKRAHALEEKHRQLIEVREMLAASEKKMIRRWARGRAATIVGWLMVLAIVSAAGSWFTSDHYFPATVTASVVVEAQTRTAAPLDEENAAQWAQWHTEIFADESFRRTLAKRMSERRLDHYATLTSIGHTLDQQFTIDSAERGRMVLTLAGADTGQLTAALDVIASTLVRESKRQSGKRSDGAWAIIDGQRKENGHVRYASLNDYAIRDERLAYAGMIFGGSFSALVLLVVVVYFRLSQAKRIFDEEDPMLATEAVETNQ